MTTVLNPSVKVRIVGYGYMTPELKQYCADNREDCTTAQQIQTALLQNKDSKQISIDSQNTISSSQNRMNEIKLMRQTANNIPLLSYGIEDEAYQQLIHKIQKKHIGLFCFVWFYFFL